MVGCDQVDKLLDVSYHSHWIGPVLGPVISIVIKGKIINIDIFIHIYSLNGGNMLNVSECLMSNSAPEPVVILLIRNLEMC